MLSKRSQTQKATYCMITFIYEMSKEAKPETQKLVVARPGWGAKWGVSANGYRVSFWGYANVLELDSDDGCIT